MPRPRRSHGRPGTRVIPRDFEASHARVFDKTHTGTVTIYPPATAGTTIKTELSYDGSTDTTPLVVDEPARIQALNAEETATLVGDQTQLTTAYLVAVNLDVVEIPVYSTIKVTDSNDATLGAPRLLTIRRIARGTLRFERYLYAVDDLNTPLEA